jgi:hypothetical protein
MTLILPACMIEFTRSEHRSRWGEGHAKKRSGPRSSREGVSSQRDHAHAGGQRGREHRPELREIRQRLGRARKIERGVSLSEVLEILFAGRPQRPA